MLDINIDNLEDILNKIHTGQLKHNQFELFKGDAACIAGWTWILGNDYTDVPPPEERWGNRETWVWSRDYNNLTEEEAKMFFAGSATLDLHLALMDYFIKGGRIKLVEGYTYFTLETVGETVYNNDYVTVKINKSLPAKLGLSQELTKELTRLEKLFRKCIKNRKIKVVTV